MLLRRNTSRFGVVFGNRDGLFAVGSRQNRDFVRSEFGQGNGDRPAKPSYEDEDRRQAHEHVQGPIDEEEFGQGASKLTHHCNVRQSEQNA